MTVIMMTDDIVYMSENDSMIKGYRLSVLISHMLSEMFKSLLYPTLYDIQSEYKHIYTFE